MNFPLDLRFKIVALAPQLTVTDASGGPICYVKQKLFKLKEAVQVYTDASKSDLVCEIKADRIIDFNACYKFTAPNGTGFGSIRRKGMNSLWKAHYEILNGEEVVMSIREASALLRLANGLVESIPFVGALSGYFLHPSYIVTDTVGTPLAKMKKMPALWEGRFQIEKLADLTEANELRIVISYCMMVLLERSRG